MKTLKRNFSYNHSTVPNPQIALSTSPVIRPRAPYSDSVQASVTCIPLPMQVDESRPRCHGSGREDMFVCVCVCVCVQGGQVSWVSKGDRGPFVRGIRQVFPGKN